MKLFFNSCVPSLLERLGDKAWQTWDREAALEMLADLEVLGEYLASKGYSGLRHRLKSLSYASLYEDYYRALICKWVNEAAIMEQELEE